VGAADITAKVNTVLKPEAAAVTFTVPSVDPAVTVTCAWPLLLVATLGLETTAEPAVTVNVTVVLTAGAPVLLLTCTTKALAKAALTKADWLLPEIIEIPVTVTGALEVSVKIARAEELVAAVALIVNVPVKDPAMVKVLLAWPLVPVVVDGNPKTPAEVGETVQFTVCPDSTFPPGPVTVTTSGCPKA